MPRPDESNEYREHEQWIQKSRNKSLEPNKCISGWIDICGFGSFLNDSSWNLEKLQEKGIFQFLSNFYAIAGKPLLIGVDPLPNDKVLILNDGIAHTIDLKNKDKLSGYLFLFFIRDLIFTHYRLLELTKNYGVGVRTILAGGERTQYSPIKLTGHSLLHYEKENISDFGKKILDTTFVYNPAEFQMNTAFAKAFTIDSKGSKFNVRINGLYFEKSFIDLIQNIKAVEVKIEKDSVDFFHEKELVFKLSIREKFKLDLKGLEVELYHIDNCHIYEAFDGDDLDFSLFRE